MSNGRVRGVFNLTNVNIASGIFNLNDIHIKRITLDEWPTLARYNLLEGGSTTTSGDFKIHTFTSSANVIIKQVGEVDSSISYLLIGGGGGGRAAGGGAGGFSEGTASIPSAIAVNTNVTILVGAGGLSGLPGGNTSISIFPAITAVSGGGGGQIPVAANGTTYKGGNGGSGGGSGGNSNVGSTEVPGGAGIPGQGNPGGAGYGNPGSPSGGGGGATSPGSPYSSGMAGGAGKQSSISGSPVYYAGGGGGGSYNVGSGSGGIGGGGNGSSGGTPAGSGAPNLGGGGGGTGGSGTNGSGGSGIAIIKYRYQ